MNEIVKLAIDAHRGRIPAQYSQDDPMEVLRKALVDANNGKTAIDYKSVRDGKCNGLFAIIETIIDKEVVDGIQEDPYFMTAVDFRNMALGDLNEFYAPDKSLFTVSEIADGNQGVRRQRLNGGEKLTITPTIKAIRIYEELSRVLSGRVDMNMFIDRVSMSFKNKIYEDMAKIWSSISADDLGERYYPTVGTYDDRALLKLIQHVESETGKKATIFGTKLGLSVIDPKNISDKAKDDLYDIGILGKFYGTPIVEMRNFHRAGTDSFLIDDNKFFITTSDVKPIKYVTEGESTIILGNPTDNADLTQEYLCMQKTGAGLLVSEKMGCYEFSDTL